MKKLILLLMTLLPFMASAQSYDQLWGSVKEAKAKDLPKTEMDALDKIVAKATRERKYGHLLAATLQRASVQTTISPDLAKWKLPVWRQRKRKRPHRQ